jgi:D-3-phosphoglycerate dehydrogenase
LPDPVESLILDLLEWLDAGPRPYAEVMEAWRTSCPRLPVWEEANDRGYLQRQRPRGQGELVILSPAGRTYLRGHRQPVG